MAFSTVDEARYNLGKVLKDITDILDYLDDITIEDLIEERIAFADKVTKTRLTPYIPAAILQTWEDLDDVPAQSKNVVGLLSQYKTCEMFIVHVFPLRHDGDERLEDVKYWQLKFEMLLAEIEAGKIILYFPDDVLVNTIKPKLTVKKQEYFGNEAFGGVCDRD